MGPPLGPARKEFFQRTTLRTVPGAGCVRGPAVFFHLPLAFHFRAEDNQTPDGVNYSDGRRPNGGCELGHA